MLVAVATYQHVKKSLNYAAYVKHHGKPPRTSDFPYRMENGRVLSRPQLPEVLKGAAMECGIPASRVDSHSLRRGGSSESAYAAAGVPDRYQDIMRFCRFGRWTSDGYRVYVATHADMKRKGLLDPATNACTPRFEMH